VKVKVVSTADDGACGDGWSMFERLGTSVLCEDISAGGSDDEMLTPEPCAPDMDI
jgi:hypothetical protein